MALQGSIDTFALDDVLRLVAGTGKTGRFTLTGPRGQGVLVVRDGAVLDGAVSTDERASDLHELVFELLRFDEGDFSFEAEAVDGYEDFEAAEVDALIDQAAELLAEWRHIEKVVPGDGALVSLSLDGPGEDVVVSPADWRVIASIGAGSSVAELSHRLDSSQLVTCRVVRSLVENGLVDVEAGGTAPATEVALGDASWDVAEVADDADDRSYAAFAIDPLADDDLVVEGAGSTNGNGSSNGDAADVDADVLFESIHEFAVDDVDLHPDAAGLAADGPVYEGIDAAEFARRLADLPPHAARAVAAAARASTLEEREAALAELDGTGEEVDHEVLLQLLGPVEG